MRNNLKQAEAILSLGAQMQANRQLPARQEKLNLRKRVR